MKWFGFLVLTVAGMLIGISAQKEKQQRVRALNDIEMLLLDLEKRLQFTAVPVREWLGEAIHHPQFQHLSFLKDVLQLLSTTDLETAWQTAAENVQGLSAEDTAALKRLGTQLGKSDTQTQVHCIREAVADVVANKTKAMQLAEKARKLYVGLGTCAGMAIGLLLV